MLLFAGVLIRIFTPRLPGGLGLLLLVILHWATPTAAASPDHHAPELPGSPFTIQEQRTEDGLTHITLTLQGQIQGHTRLAPLDHNLRPSCQQLAESVRQALLLREDELHYECGDSPSAELMVSFELQSGTGPEPNNWLLKGVHWSSGWMQLHGRLKQGKPVYRRDMRQLMGHQRQLLGLSGSLGQRYPGLGTMQARSTPQQLWQWLAGSKWSLLNGGITVWHGYELLSHSLALVKDARDRQWYGLILNLLALGFHGLDGLAHADNTMLGRYAHLDFQTDLIMASGHPHAANTGLTGSALVVTLLDFLRDAHPGHSHGHAHGSHYSLGDTLLTLMEVWHAGTHVHEFWGAINDWIYNREVGHHHH